MSHSGCWHSPNWLTTSVLEKTAKTGELCFDFQSPALKSTPAGLGRMCADQLAQLAESFQLHSTDRRCAACTANASLSAGL
jgi:hypothetical protein